MFLCFFSEKKLNSIVVSQKFEKVCMCEYNKQLQLEIIDIFIDDFIKIDLNIQYIERFNHIKKKINSFKKYFFSFINSLNINNNEKKEFIENVEYMYKIYYIEKLEGLENCDNNNEKNIKHNSIINFIESINYMEFCLLQFITLYANIEYIYKKIKDNNKNITLSDDEIYEKTITHINSIRWIKKLNTNGIDYSKLKIK